MTTCAASLEGWSDIHDIHDIARRSTTAVLVVNNQAINLSTNYDMSLPILLENLVTAAVLLREECRTIAHIPL